MEKFNEAIEPNNMANKFGKLLNVNFFIWFTLFAIGLSVSSFSTAGLALIAGVLGAIWSLLFAKSLAKKAHDIEVIDANHPTHAGLYEIVYDLSLKAGIPTPEVGVYDSQDMNAFATGFSQKNSIVAFSTALLEKMSIPEIQAVAAHEIGHIVSRDMIAMSLFQGIISAVIILFTFPIQAIRVLNVFTNDNGTTFFIDAILWVVKFIGMIILTFFGSLVVNMFSRQREYRADAIAGLLVGKNAMISALQKLSNDTAEPTKALMSYNTMKISAPQRFMEWFSTHPLISNRVQALEYETYLRLAEEKNIYKRSTASILAIFFGYLGAHHFYMKHNFAGFSYIFFSIFMYPLALIEAFLYWTQAKTNEEFEEKFVKQDGVRIIRLIVLPITFMAFLMFAISSESENADQNINIENATPKEIQTTIPESSQIPNTATKDLSEYVGKFPTDILEDPLVNKKVRTLVGNEYDHLTGNIGVSDSLIEEGNYYIGWGIAPHSGGYEEAIFAISKDLQHIFVIIMSEGENFIWFSSDYETELPEKLHQWHTDRQQSLNQ